MELKARLASLEQQINSLQTILNKENYTKSSNENSQENLKSILMKLKMEHEGVLRGIEKALELVDCTPPSPSLDHLRTPEKMKPLNLGGSPSSPSPRLREKINSALNGGISNTGISSGVIPNSRHQVIASSPLSSAVEKSHITFDILNELENQQQSQQNQQKLSGQKRKVHFNSSIDGEEEMSVASREYLRKYGLI